MIGCEFRLSSLGAGPSAVLLCTCRKSLLTSVLEEQGRFPKRAPGIRGFSNLLPHSMRRNNQLLLQLTAMLWKESLSYRDPAGRPFYTRPLLHAENCSHYCMLTSISEISNTSTWYLIVSQDRSRQWLQRIGVRCTARTEENHKSPSGSPLRSVGILTALWVYGYAIPLSSTNLFLQRLSNQRLCRLHGYTTPSSSTKCALGCCSISGFPQQARGLCHLWHWEPTCRYRKYRLITLTLGTRRPNPRYTHHWSPCRFTGTRLMQCDKYRRPSVRSRPTCTRPAPHSGKTDQVPNASVFTVVEIRLHWSGTGDSRASQSV